MKYQGLGQLLHDRHDSIYRTNKVELDAPTKADKRRQKKLKSKWKSRIGNATAELHDKNQALKAKNDQKSRGTKDLVKDDVIII